MDPRPAARWTRAEHLRDAAIMRWGQRRDEWTSTPPYDFGLLYRDLGPTVLEASLESYARVHAAEKDRIRRRAHFFGRWRVLENIAYGLTPQERGVLRRGDALADVAIPMSIDG